MNLPSWGLDSEDETLDYVGMGVQIWDGYGIFLKFG